MSSGVAAKATDSSPITDTSPQPLLAPSAAVDPANQPIPGVRGSHGRNGGVAPSLLIYMASCVVSVTATTPRIVMATIVELPAGSYPPG